MADIVRKYSLKELRARKNVTQAVAAEALGVSPQTYCAWEKDLSPIAISRVMKIAEYYGVDIAEIRVP